MFKQPRVVFHLLPPPSLTTQFQWLPPMLHMNKQTPISDYSKGSWGLSVLLRESGIFTGLTISPRTTLRQCPDRYTIRAGRNLPDKEFRYLRTVIVTAGVHPRFNSRLLPEGITHPLNVRTLARHQPLYITLQFSRDLCFW